MREKKEQRLDYLDIAKGIGITLVVVGHSTYAGVNLLTWIASFHMPLFFIISGMLLQYTFEENNKYIEIVRKKSKSIMLPYISFSAIYLLMDVLMMQLHVGNVQFVDFFYGLIGSVTCYGISTLWFLPALFFGELLFLFIRKKWNHYVTIGIGILFMVVVGLTHPVFDAYYPLYNAIYYLIPGYLLIVLYRSAVAYIFIMFGYYVQGYAMDCVDSAKKGIPLGIILILTGMAFAFANGRVDLHSVIFKNNLYFYIAAMAGTIGTVLLCKYVKEFVKLKYLKPLLLAGKNSLIIMATHLEFKVMIIAIRGAEYISNRLPMLLPYIQWILVGIFLIIMESMIIYVMNHYFYFLIGKKKPHNRRNLHVVK